MKQYLPCSCKDTQEMRWKCYGITFFFLFFSSSSLFFFFSLKTHSFSLYLVKLAENARCGGWFLVFILFSLASISKMHLMHIISTSLFMYLPITSSLLLKFWLNFSLSFSPSFAGHFGLPWEANLASQGSLVQVQLNRSHFG